MVNFDERFQQLIIERDLDYNSFLDVFYKTYGYMVECRGLPPVYALKDLSEFFGVSCNYLLGISSSREFYSASADYDKIFGLANVIFTSDKFDKIQLESMYAYIYNMLT